jgi:ATP/maltotriose-dependent transcriptional regulator MalT
MKLLIANCGSQITRKIDGESNLHADTLLAYSDTLLAAFPERLEARDSRLGDAAQASRLQPPASELVEPLSERELDVLRLLGTYLSGPEIARELIGVPEHTANPHQKHLRQARGEQPSSRGSPG